MLPIDIFEALYTNLLNDSRLSVCHYNIYIALILLWHKNKLANPFPVSRKGIMELAHVHSIVTYHKCIGHWRPTDIFFIIRLTAIIIEVLFILIMV